LGSLDNWASLAKKFGEGFKTYIIDLRNHGQSPHSEDMDFELMAKDVLDLMDDQNIHRANLIGHSMGGKVAMQLALTRSERVGKLVIVDIAPRTYPPRHEDIFKGLLTIDLAQLTSRDEADRILSRYVPEQSMRQFLLKNLTRDEHSRFKWRMNLDGVYRSYQRLNEAVGSAQQFTGPVLFVRGGNSDYIRDEDHPLILKSFPNARFATIMGAGHWVHADAPSEFTGVVLEFLLS
jgi:pimeloyl-ACP methyl ester carboxylesterase